MDALRSLWWKMLLFLLLAAAVAWWVFIPWYIYENGTAAQARVLETWSTGTMVNDEPLVGMRLEVRQQAAAGFEVEKRCRASWDNGWMFQPGAQVEVRFHPNFPGRVILASGSCDGEFSSMFLVGAGTIGLTLLGFMVVPPLMRRLSGRPDLIQKGHPAVAQVVEVEETGWTINDKPQLKLLLEVEPPGGSPYLVSTKMLVSPHEVAQIVPGITAKVKYNQDKPMQVAVVSFEKAAKAEAAPGQHLKMLDALRDQDLISEEEYQKARGKIIPT